MYACARFTITYYMSSYLVFALQYVLITHLSVHMVVLMANSHHVSPVSSVVIMLLTVLEGKMNWITTVLVDLREQYV